MTFYLNDYVCFELTEFGKEIWESHLERYAEKEDGLAETDHRPGFRQIHLETAAKLRAEKSPAPTEMQMFRFMQLFGPHMGAGRRAVIKDLTLYPKVRR